MEALYRVIHCISNRIYSGLGGKYVAINKLQLYPTRRAGI